METEAPLSEEAIEEKELALDAEAPNDSER